MPCQTVGYLHSAELCQFPSRITECSSSELDCSVLVFHHRIVSSRLSSNQLCLVQVQESIAWCGIQLSADERLRALCKGTGSNARSSQSSQETASGLMTVAQQARTGVFESLQVFQAAAMQAVGLPLSAHSSPGRSQSVLSAVLDEIDCWCYSIATALKI